MAARRIYSGEDRARAYVVFTANGGNIKRTARDASIPVTTLRDWVRDWEAGDIPDVSIVQQAAGDFLTDAERVRDKALAELERKLGDATPSALVTTVGVLTDKINLTKGLATSRTETVHALPSPDEMAALVAGAFQAAIQAAEQRDLEIIDAEVVAELPPASS